MELVQIYFINFNKITIVSYFLAFFLYLFFSFSLLDPDQRIKSGSRGENECRSGSTALSNIQIKFDKSEKNVPYDSINQGNYF